MEQRHYIQLNILKKLLFSEALRYSDLRPFAELENNLLTFHIDQLVKDKLIEKSADRYQLTKSGKEYANRMDTDKVEIKPQAKISAITCCMRGDKEYEFLIYTRLKHPFFGSQGYSSGKVQYGEKTIEAAKRELKEETNLEADPDLFMIEHHLVYNKATNALLEDKFFFFYRFRNPTGELKPNNEGRFEWVKEKDLRTYFSKPFETVEKMLYYTEKLKDFTAEVSYTELEHYTDNF